MPAGGELLLNLQKVEVVYHRVSIAIQGVSLKVEDGQIVTLLGTNGAGKSTTLRAISGFLGIDDAKITEGSIEFLGEKINNKRPDDITRKGIVLIPERDKIFQNLTVEENLNICDNFKRQTGKEGLSGVSFDYFPSLAKVRNRLGGYLSGGERQMLALAMGLRCQPRLLLIDEMSLGLAPRVVDELINLVASIRNDLKTAVLLVEQNAMVALDIADYGYVMENGRIVFDGDSRKLKNHEDIQEFYLGRAEKEERSYRDVKQYRRTRRWYG
jgi:branched-chain amino acid transport system ATP-binding protein